VRVVADHLDALAVLEFLYEVGEIASGDDIRERLFGWRSGRW
jgi:hypothetical protein